MIIYNYVANNEYEFFNITENIQDSYSVYNLNPNVKQIFYYDDFLGETHLTKNEDSSLITFINRINKSKNKKLILTAREYILQQSKLLYEKIEKFDFKKCIIDLKNYTNKIKADILYSHLYFSELPQEYAYVLFEKIKQYTAKENQYILIDLLISIIIKTGNLSLINNLETEFAYLIKNHELSEMEYFLNKLTLPIFKQNKIAGNFINNFLDSVVRNIYSCKSIYDLDILMNFIDDYDEDLIEKYESDIKFHITDKFNISNYSLREMENAIDEFQAQQELDEDTESENSNYLKQNEDDKENIKDLFLTLKNNVILK